MARQPESEAPKIGVQATALVTASFLSGKQAFSLCAWAKFWINQYVRFNLGAMMSLPRHRHRVHPPSPPMGSFLSLRPFIHARGIHCRDRALWIRCPAQARFKSQAMAYIHSGRCGNNRYGALRLVD